MEGGGGEGGGRGRGRVTEGWRFFFLANGECVGKIEKVGVGMYEQLVSFFQMIERT